jgi:acyl-CoA hydrolase
MDVGGGIFASKTTKSRAVTVAVEAMNFGVMKPTENALGR